ncbi:2-dehydropantoate 2-reductase [Ferdinandcohnia sp. Marseille-Q9671]
MKIGIIGGGSIGLLFAGYLADRHDVTIYTRTEIQSEYLRSKGITIRKNDTTKTYRIHADTTNASVIEEELLVVAVKQYSLEDVLTKVKDIEKVQTICFLQNGMGHIDLLEQLTNPNVLVGVVEHGAMKVNEVTVKHTGVGRTKIGIFKGTHNTVSHALGSINDFPFEFHNNWHDILSAKLIANAIVNPLTALYRVKNGELLQNKYFYNQMKTLFNEVTSVIQSNTNDVWELVTSICQSTANNKSSMLRDIEEGRKTEVDAILGYIVKKAATLNKEIVITTFLYHSIKGIEKRGE